MQYRHDLPLKMKKFAKTVEKEGENVYNNIAN